jgi:hypothetical protein
LTACRPYFRFALADIGPHEAFGDYLLLRELVQRLKEAQFLPRLLTSAKHFSQTAECIQQFIELKELGAHRIILRLDEESAEGLSEQNVSNYGQACAASGFAGELRFDLEDSVPRAFLRVARQIETSRFYTTIYPKKRLNIERTRFNGHPLSRLSTRKFRVVINAAGSVFLREHDQTTTREIWIGELSSTSLAQIIHPRRVGQPDGVDSDGVGI